MNFERGVKRLGAAAATWKAYQELSANHGLVTLTEQWTFIDSDEGGRMPLVLRRGARFILRIIDRYWRKNWRLHLRVLKSRRQGCSTAIQCGSLQLGTKIPYWKTLSLADKDEHTQTLIDITRFAQEEMRFGPGGKWGRGGKGGSPRLVMGRPCRSRFEYETSGGKNVGRSKGYRFLHRSEVAFMGDVIAQEAGLLATIPKHVGFTVVIDESTANGAGGPFYRGWTEGWKRPKRGVFSVFLPWIIDERCYVEVTDEELDQYRWDALDEEEKVLVERFGVCVEQLAFRRLTLETDCNGDVDYFNQEFPTTPADAWLTAGRQVFERKILLWIGSNVERIQPVAAGDLVRLPDDASSLSSPEGAKPWRKAVAEAGREAGSLAAGSPGPTTTGMLPPMR